MAARKVYFVEGLGLLLLTFALFISAATGQEREVIQQYVPGPEGEQVPYYEVRLSEIEVFLLFFSWMLVWAGLGVVLGLVQPYVALPAGLKLINAFTFGVGVLTYIFGYYWNVWKVSQVPDSLENPITWPVFLGGLLLMMSLGMNAVGGARFFLTTKS